MIRIHLTTDDLVRVRIVPTLGPLAETLFAVELGPRQGSASLLFDRWRQAVGTRTGRWARPLFELVRFPTPIDLFTLTGAVTCVGEGTDALLRTPATALRREIDYAIWSGSIRTAANHSLTWIQELPTSLPARRQLVEMLHRYHDAAVGPYWSRIRGHLEAMVTTHAHTLAGGGVEQVLASLHPDLCWRRPALEVTTGLTSRTVDLAAGGRGLTLVPSVFCRSTVVLNDLSRPEIAPLVCFPAMRHLREAVHLWCPDDPPHPGGALSALLGPTRAAALQATTGGCSTSQLAQRLGISPGTVSHHTTVLRGAGLITTHRTGTSVRHDITPLGTSLLNSADP